MNSSRVRRPGRIQTGAGREDGPGGSKNDEEEGEEQDRLLWQTDGGSTGQVGENKKCPRRR